MFSVVNSFSVQCRAGRGSLWGVLHPMHQFKLGAFTHGKTALRVPLLQCLTPAKGAFWKAAGTVSFSVIGNFKCTGLPYNGNWPLSKAIKKLK